MVKSAWYDIEMRGRRLEALSKRMNTEFWLAINANKSDLALGYLDAILRVEKLSYPYVDQITGLNRFLKQHERKENLISN